MIKDNEIRRSQDADRILKEPLFIEAFHSIEASILNAMKQCAINDHSTQHELILTLQLLGRLNKFFVDIINTGKLAMIQKESTESIMMKDISNRY